MPQDGNDPNDLPSPKEALSHNAHGGDSFSSSELAQIRVAFKRFKMQDCADVHKDDLPDILKFLGHACSQHVVDVKEAADEVADWSTLDFDEFSQFLELYALKQQERAEVLFTKFVATRHPSQDAIMRAIKEIVSALGLLPHNRKVREALEMVGVHDLRQLGVAELKRFVAAYRYAGGFTRSEVDKLRRTFCRYCEEDEATGYAKLPLAALARALVANFGLVATKEAEQLQQSILEAEAAHGRKADVGDAEGLWFPGFIACARHLRQAQFTSCCAEFGRFDSDKSGRISCDELREALRAMGFEPRGPVLDEVFIAAGTTPDGQELDLDVFFNFLLVLQEREGFLLAELDELRHVFVTFDRDNSQDINPAELTEIVRYLGYVMTADEINALLSQADLDSSTTLDFLEFARLMRIHREAQLLRTREVYDANVEVLSGMLRFRDVAPALAEMGFPESDVPAAREAGDIGGGIGWDHFVSLVDDARAARARERRQKAGFADEDVVRFRLAFDACKKEPESKLIGLQELEPLLHDLELLPRSKAEQQMLLALLAEAHQASRAAGVRKEDLSPQPGPGHDPAFVVRVSFLEFVQLVRILCDRRDKDEERRVRHVAETCRFSKEEVDAFREHFVEWARRSAGTMEQDGSPGGYKAAVGFLTGGVSSVARLKMSAMVFRRLLRTLGVGLSMKNRHELEGKVADYASCGSDQLCFADFLQLMRWLLDSDFGGINSVCSRAAAAEAAA